MGSAPNPRQRGMIPSQWGMGRSPTIFQKIGEEAERLQTDRSYDLENICLITYLITRLICQHKTTNDKKGFHSMKQAKLSHMKKGWFVGNFDPTVYKTNAVEVAIKHYKKGTIENEHYHKLATEITVIISGRVMMNDAVFSDGDIILLDPMEPADFHVLADTVTAVVKLPGTNDDKYLGKPNG